VSLDCPCGFGPRFDLGPFSQRWYREHREHHLTTFPDADEGTRRNLADAIRRSIPELAEEVEQ
jgi:fatty acid desaturase